MSTEKIMGAVAAAVAGLLVGWAGNALTLTGRVTAMEAQLTRIENRLFPPAAAGTVARAAP